MVGQILRWSLNDPGLCIIPPFDCGQDLWLWWVSSLVMRLRIMAKFKEFWKSLDFELIEREIIVGGSERDDTPLLRQEAVNGSSRGRARNRVPCLLSLHCPALWSAPLSTVSSFSPTYFFWDTKQNKPLEYLCTQRQTYNFLKSEQLLWAPAIHE